MIINTVSDMGITTLLYYFYDKGRLHSYDKS